MEAGHSVGLCSAIVHFLSGHEVGHVLDVRRVWAEGPAQQYLLPAVSSCCSTDRAQLLTGYSIASATMAITFLLSVAAVVVLLIHLLWNTVDIFVIREQNRIQDEEATTATATEVSPLLPSSQALVRGDSTPAVQIPDYRHSTPRLPDTPQCPSTHPRPRSPPLSDIMLPVPGDSPPDFNPYGISWVLGPWNPISIMLWIRACSQAARDDQHLERVSDDGAGDLDPFCPPVLNP